MATYSTHADLKLLWADLDDLLGLLSVPEFSGSGVLNDLSHNSTYLGDSDVGYLVQIDGISSPNTFRWSGDDGMNWYQELVPITGEAQILSDGVEITFGSTDGHSSLDSWEFFATAPNSESQRQLAYDWLNDSLRSVYTVPFSSPSHSVIMAEALYAVSIILQANDNPASFNLHSQAIKAVEQLIHDQLVSAKKGNIPVTSTLDVEPQFTSGTFDENGTRLSTGSLDEW